MNTPEQLYRMAKLSRVHVKKVKDIHGVPFILKAVKMGVGSYFVNKFAFLFEQPRFLFFEITNECNLHCRGCLQGVDNFQQDINPLLDDPRFFQLINSYPNIIVSGGEPLMPQARPFLFELLDKHKKGTVTVITNGTLIDREFAEKVANNHRRYVGVSIDGTKEVHDQRRGIGSFDKTMAGIELLNEVSANWSPFITTTNQNFDNVTSLEFRDFITSIGAYPILYIPYMPTNCEENKELELSREQLVALKETIEKFKKFGEKSGNVFFNLFDGEYKLMRGCAAGGKVRYIDYKGNVMPCPFITYSPFNVREILDGKRPNFDDAFFDEMRRISNENGKECIIRNTPHLVMETYEKYQKSLKLTAQRTDMIIKAGDQNAN